MARLELQNGGIFPENYSHVEVPTLARLRAFIPENPHVKAYCKETDIHYYWNGTAWAHLGNLMQYVQFIPGTIANTTAKTSVLNPATALGTNRIPSALLVPGAMFRAYLLGYLSAGASVTATLEYTFGGVALFTSAGTIPNNISNGLVETTFTFGVTQDSKILGQGRSTVVGTGGFNTSISRALVMPSPVTVNLANDPALEGTYQWGTAAPGNTVTLTSVTLERLL